MLCCVGWVGLGMFEGAYQQRDRNVGERGGGGSGGVLKIGRISVTYYMDEYYSVILFCILRTGIYQNLGSTQVDLSLPIRKLIQTLTSSDSLNRD